MIKKMPVQSAVLRIGSSGVKERSKVVMSVSIRRDRRVIRGRGDGGWSGAPRIPGSFQVAIDHVSPRHHGRDEDDAQEGEDQRVLLVRRQLSVDPPRQ